MILTNHRLPITHHRFLLITDTDHRLPITAFTASNPSAILIPVVIPIPIPMTHIVILLPSVTKRLGGFPLDLPLELYLEQEIAGGILRRKNLADPLQVPLFSPDQLPPVGLEFIENAVYLLLVRIYADNIV